MTPGLLHRARMALGLSQQELADRLRKGLLAMLDERAAEVAGVRNELTGKDGRSR